MGYGWLRRPYPIISSNIMLKKISLFLIILCLFSCGGNQYFNKKYKYTVTLPPEYIIIEDGIPTEQSEQMKNRINAEGALPVYQGVDAAFYDNTSFGPVFDTVTVAALNKPFSMKQIEQSQATIEVMFLQMLTTRYEDVRIVQSGFEKFQSGQAYKANFTFTYKNKNCSACVVLLTNNILYSTLFTMMCPVQNEDKMIKALYDMINSFKRKF